MNVETLKNQIAEKSKELSEAQAELEGLRLSRAELSTGEASKTNATKIRKLDEQIRATNEIIQNAPHELQFLNEHLTAAQRAVTEKAKAALLSQQKSCAGQMEALSVKLVKALEVANGLNIQLDGITRRYCALLEQTGHEIPMKATCRGSEQFLKLVYETCKAELNGILQPRTAGQPPWVRI